MTSLPESLRSSFWDYDFDALDTRRDRHLVIERVLTRGPWEAQKWLRRTFGDDELRAWMTTRRARSLSPRQLTLWQLLLGLPESEVASWLAERRRSPWFARTRREASP